MGGAAGSQHQGALGRIDPLVVHEKAQRALDDVEHVIFGMRVRAGPLGVGLEPPLGNGIGAGRFFAVGLEQRRDPSHRITAPLSGRKDDGLAPRSHGFASASASSCSLVETNVTKSTGTNWHSFRKTSSSRSGSNVPSGTRSGVPLPGCCALPSLSTRMWQYPQPSPQLTASASSSLS